MNTYKRHRFPPDIISFAVWLYYRFILSHRNIEDLLAERSITVSREAIRLWWIKFGALYVSKLKRKHRGYYGVAHREIMPEIIQVTDRYASNRAEQSHQPTRIRKRGVRRFKSIVQARRFLDVHSPVCNLFNLGRHLISASRCRIFRMRAFASCKSAVA